MACNCNPIGRIVEGDRAFRADQGQVAVRRRLTMRSAGPTIPRTLRLAAAAARLSSGTSRAR